MDRRRGIGKEMRRISEERREVGRSGGREEESSRGLRGED